MKLSSEIVDFLKTKKIVSVATFDSRNNIHISIKAVIEADKEGKVYIFDLYRGQTYRNLKRNPTITISTLSESQFKGYALSGKAEIISLAKAGKNLQRNWDENIVKRISHRLIRNIKRGHKSLKHPEAEFPSPKYLILVKVSKVVNLAKFS